MNTQSCVSKELSNFVGRAKKLPDGKPNNAERYALLLKILGDRFDPRRMRRSSARCFASAIFRQDYLRFICRSTDRSALLFSDNSFSAKVLTPYTTYPVMRATAPSESVHGPSRSDSTVCGPTFSAFDLISTSTSRALMERLLFYRRNHPHLTRFSALQADFEEIAFARTKFFTAGLSEDHDENFYMEREWRMHEGLAFRLGEVARIFLPRDYC